MAFIALGINHKTASVAVRERVAFSPDRLTDALRELCREAGAREAAILSTCNRSELYLEMEPSQERAVIEWLANYHGLQAEELHSCAYTHTHEQAVRHMMRVACGLDSLVLGEPQILGQIKSSYAVAREAGTLGPLLGRLFQATFSTAKTVRTDTAIGENPVSVAFAAVSLAKQIFSDLSQSQALLIGAGETITLVARHLHEQGLKNIVVANRTLERAALLTEEFGAKAVLLSEIPDALIHSDIVISSTASQLPILGKGAVERALKLRKHKPIFMVDIAVPRDIESQVGELDDVYLYTVDDLHEVVSENLKSRQGAAKAAEDLVVQGTSDFMQRLRELEAVDVLRSYRQQGEQLRDEELQKALRSLANGTNAEDALTQLARGLTNKLLHTPSVQLKRLSADGRHEALAVAQELFGLNSGETN
ncbi:glutamyl-tRNA reductase [Thiopseudomonas acetoxidans]|uniref:Glutamyl-tRNA reductase n=1 Tax=Thiopseudomonas acetoxidans TaxID=3041622 RepID=A0ABT7SLC1_9GAMM|nr:glutamyl-tRNA reductase [Thiopseudomonas sp. CY1220]MDM7856989.1 glutamyl-tRNA reductase [Thiopseudomonas sp. CY1220]